MTQAFPKAFGAAAAAIAIAIATLAHAHGDVAPQAVDTTGLPEVGEEWLTENPYRAEAAGEEVWAAAVEIGFGLASPAVGQTLVELTFRLSQGAGDFGQSFHSEEEHEYPEDEQQFADAWRTHVSSLDPVVSDSPIQGFAPRRFDSEHTAASRIEPTTIDNRPISSTRDRGEERHLCPVDEFGLRRAERAILSHLDSLFQCLRQFQAGGEVGDRRSELHRDFEFADPEFVHQRAEQANGHFDHLPDVFLTHRLRGHERGYNTWLSLART